MYKKKLNGTQTPYTREEAREALDGVSSVDILRAIAEFNSQFPNTNAYHDWLHSGNYKYALEYKGRPYPPKKIMSLATNMPTVCFYGGWGTHGVNGYLEREGFEIVPKPLTASSEGIENLIRPDLVNFGGYAAATSPETLEGKVEVPVESIIKLDANENPYGCSPRVRQALAAYPNFNIYPDDGQTRLRKLLEGYSGVAAKHIVAGGGSNQLIDLVLRLFISRGDEVINCVPTFGIYRFSTELCGGSLVEVPRQANFAVNVSAVKAAITKKTKIIFLANPNSPTGTLIPRSDIVELLGTGVPLVVDEAYYEFSGQTVAPLVSQYPNLMVLRTFSKWAGLAGLRVGYGLFPPQIAGYLLRIKMPYNVNVAALVAVEESLKDIDYLMSNIQSIVTERGRLFSELENLKWLKPYPSQANFVFCEVLRGRAKELWQKLQDRGILIRYFDQPLLRNFIRISVGKPEHTAALMKALREIGGK